MKGTILGAAVAALAACAGSNAAGQSANFAPSSAAKPAETVLRQDEIAIRAVLAAQAKAWNAGDLEGFMEGYWRSPELRFASGGAVRRGYDATLARYKQAYPNRAAMGRLRFSDLDVDVVSADAATAHGAWALTRTNDAPSGLFTLVFRKIDGDWVIVSDTTTSAEPG